MFGHQQITSSYKSSNLADLPYISANDEQLIDQIEQAFIKFAFFCSEKDEEWDVFRFRSFIVRFSSDTMHNKLLRYKTRYKAGYSSGLNESFLKSVEDFQETINTMITDWGGTCILDRADLVDYVGFFCQCT